MKRKLLFLVFLLFTFFYSNSQVIDLVGIGINGKTTENLPLTDVSNIDHVKIGAFFKGSGSIPTSSDVQFYDTDDGPMSEWKTDITIKHITSPSQTIGYFDAIFNTVDVGGINVTIVPTDKVHSFYTYIYRNIPTSSIKSFTNLENVFFYHNGFNDPYVYNIPINSDLSPRNIKVKVPVSELDSGSRMVVIDIDAGSVSNQFVETTYNLGNSFFLGEYLLENIPGDVTNVTVSIYSPNPAESGEANGDSFFVSGVVVDVDKVGCTLTQGYWKTHANPNKPKKYDNTWENIQPDAENSAFFYSSKSYIEVLNTNVGKGGKYYILAYQYIAAELNILAGANPTDIQVAFDEATTFLNNWTPEAVKGNKGLEAECVRLGGILDDFNNGIIGPGHCPDDDEQTQASIEPVKQQRTKVAIYPNPATTYGKIGFTPKQNAKTTVELYNIGGQKVGVLFNEKTKLGIPVTIEFNTEQYKKGIYFLIIKNGSNIYREKISILK